MARATPPHILPQKRGLEDYDDREELRARRRSPPRLSRQFCRDDELESPWSPGRGLGRNEQRSPWPRQAPDSYFPRYEDERRFSGSLDISPPRGRRSPTRWGRNVAHQGRPSSDTRRPRLFDAGKPTFQNLKWRNPDLPSSYRKISLDATVDEDEAADVEKVEFNGVAGVPTGPRGPVSSHSLPNVGPEVRQAPHIFIPSTSVPAAAKTVRHLYRFLSKTEPDQVAVDCFGYYVIFPNDQEGRQRMNACVSSRNGQILFGMYTVQMQVFENGQPPYDHADIVHCGATDHPAVVEKSSAQEPVNEDTAPERNSSSQDTARLVASRKSSPTRPSSRIDADNVSVISGRTISSNSSASARNKCHVCKAVFTTSDVVAQCSSCPRRYHRRCHKPTPVAALESGSTPGWQCKRCVKLSVPLPSTTAQSAGKNANKKAGTTEAFANGQGAGTSKLLERTNVSHAAHDTIFHKLALPQKENNDPDNKHSSRLPSTYQQTAISPDAHQAPPARVPAAPMVPEFIAQDDAADALVERVFDAPHASEDPTPKAGKPRLIRKRLTAGGTTSSASSEMGLVEALNGQHDDVDWEVPETPKAVIEAARRRAQEIADRGSSSHAAVEACLSKPNGSASPADSVVQNERNAAETMNPQAIATRSKTHRLSCSKCGRVKKDLPIGVTSFTCLECKKAMPTYGEDHSSVAVPAYASRPEDAKSMLAATTDVAGDAVSITQMPETTGHISHEAAKDDLDFWSPATRRPGTPHGVEFESPLQVERVGAQSLPEPDEASSSTVKPRLAMTVIAEDESSDDLSEPPDTSARPSEPPQSPRPGTSEAVPGKRVRRGKAEFTSSSNLLLRPGLTYRTLCCLAMCEADRYRLQSKGVCQWIANNIPGYVLGEDEWELRIPMILSHYDVKGSGKHTWTKQDLKPGDKGAIGPGAWYVLRPDVARSHPRWDPVLKQTVSPPRSARTAEAPVSDDSEEDELVKPSRAGKRALADRRKKPATTSKTTATAQVQHRQSGAEAADAITSDFVPAEDRMDVDGSFNRHMQDVSKAQMTPVAQQDEPSSEDTSLANLRRRSGASKSTMAPKSALVSSRTSLDDMPPTRRSGFLLRARLADETQVRQNDALMTGQDDASPPVRRSGKLGLRTMAGTDPKVQPIASAAKRLNIPIRRSGRLLSVDIDDRLSDVVQAVGQQVEYSAPSLFDEWPEYHPDACPDEEAIMLEMKKRPTRKQMFGKPAVYSRLGSGEQACSQSSFSPLPHPEPSNGCATARKSRYGGLQALPDEDEHECDSLEDFFGLPDNPIAAVRNNTLVFREGPKADGRPKRATVLYPAGCD